MSQRRILTVGFQLASSDVESVSFNSNTSLLDWDIVLIKPKIEMPEYCDYYKGKPSLGDITSFEVKESCEHWRREIRQAVDAGKTAIVYLVELQEVFIDSGERSYSGTGRNQRITRLVTQFSNYQAIPHAIAPVSASGKAMSLSVRGAEVLAPYWAQFESVSEYKVTLADPTVPACIVTRTGGRVVGALYRSKSSAGSLLLLPDIDFDCDSFVKGKGKGATFTGVAEEFAARMVSAVVALDKALRSTGEVTPTPLWAAEPKFVLKTERELRVLLLEAERKVEDAQKRKEELEDQLKAAGAHRALLFEKGKQLEAAIINALRILGFAAAPFRESDSEFDVVFESAEGRLIGEAEGKDSKAVNIDKLRQLAMNVHEDLQRETVTKPAKPVLFGNSVRLHPPSERSEPFTDKCLSAAATSSTALVFTPDLFWPVQHLLNTSDPEYARACRIAILSSTGRVTFPSPPAPEQADSEVQVEKVR